jgi:hypothetical protein
LTTDIFETLTIYENSIKEEEEENNENNKNKIFSSKSTGDNLDLEKLDKITEKELEYFLKLKK